MSPRLTLLAFTPCPQLRESGDKSSYRSAPALFGFLCDKYVQLSRFFPNKAPARAELSEVRLPWSQPRRVCASLIRVPLACCGRVQLLTKLQDKLVPAVRTAVENEDAGPVTAMLDELLPLLQGYAAQRPRTWRYPTACTTAHRPVCSVSRVPMTEPGSCTEIR